MKKYVTIFHTKLGDICFIRFDTESEQNTYHHLCCLGSAYLSVLGKPTPENKEKYKREVSEYLFKHIGEEKIKSSDDCMQLFQNILEGSCWDGWYICGPYLECGDPRLAPSKEESDELFALKKAKAKAKRKK